MTITFMYGTMQAQADLRSSRPGGGKGEGMTVGASVPSRSGGDESATLSIGEVSRKLGLRVSTLRYWEDRGLVSAAERRHGKRYYGADEVHRIALIQMWRDTGLMGLADIAEVLAAEPGEMSWRAAVLRRLESVTAQKLALMRAEAHLRHLLTCPSDQPASQCPFLRDATRKHVSGAPSGEWSAVPADHGNGT
jgi:DNA-binding transcriptional MerR regulator